MNKIKQIITNQNDTHKSANLAHAELKAKDCLYGLYRKGLLKDDNGLVVVDMVTKKLVLTELGLEAMNYLKGNIYDGIVAGTNYYVNCLDEH